MPSNTPRLDAEGIAKFLYPGREVSVTVADGQVTINKSNEPLGKFDVVRGKPVGEVDTLRARVKSLENRIAATIGAIDDTGIGGAGYDDHSSVMERIRDIRRRVASVRVFLNAAIDSCPYGGETRAALSAALRVLTGDIAYSDRELVLDAIGWPKQCHQEAAQFGPAFGRIDTTGNKQ